MRSPRIDRYNWQSKKQINFQNLAQMIEITNKQGVWQLYNFIYENKELEALIESLQYGHTSLKQHLLIIVNLIVQDFNKGLLKEFAQIKAT
ncbi:MAG: hypothetical protein ACFFCQ_04770 [Promethearchaeota archaeon]